MQYILNAMYRAKNGTLTLCYNSTDNSFNVNFEFQHKQIKSGINGLLFIFINY